MRILLVEDEKAISDALKEILQKNNYIVDQAFDGEYGLDCALSNIYDIIILDIMLPEINGLDLLKAVRKEKISVPVLMLTAKSQTEDKVMGLDAGADDYITKPFQTEELLARLRVLSRRKGSISAQINSVYGDISLNPHSLIMSCGDKTFKLTLKEGSLLDILIQAKGRIISKNYIIEKVWGFDSEAEDSNVEVYISFLRKKLKALNSKVSINTVRGKGYCISFEDKTNV